MIFLGFCCIHVIGILQAESCLHYRDWISHEQAEHSGIGGGKHVHGRSKWFLRVAIVDEVFYRVVKEEIRAPRTA